MLPPTVITDAMAWLASDAASAVTGVAPPVDAGHLLLTGTTPRPRGLTFDHVPIGCKITVKESYSEVRYYRERRRGRDRSAGAWAGAGGARIRLALCARALPHPGEPGDPLPVGRGTPVQ